MEKKEKKFYICKIRRFQIKTGFIISGNYHPLGWNNLNLAINYFKKLCKEHKNVSLYPKKEENNNIFIYINQVKEKFGNFTVYEEVTDSKYNYIILDIYEKVLRKFPGIKNYFSVFTYQKKFINKEKTKKEKEKLLLNNTFEKNLNINDLKYLFNIKYKKRKMFFESILKNGDNITILLREKRISSEEEDIYLKDINLFFKNLKNNFNENTDQLILDMFKKEILIKFNNINYILSFNIK